MYVRLARITLVIGALMLAGNALAEDSYVPTRDRDFPARRDRDSGNHRDRDSFASLRDQIIRPEPPANYYAHSGAEDRYFNVADEVQPPQPVEQGSSSPMSINNNVGVSGGGSCPSCAAALMNSGDSSCGCSAGNSCGICDECDDGGSCAMCDNPCACGGLVLFSGIDSFRGIGDRGTTANNVGNNNGGSSGINWGTRLGGFTELTGIAGQVGGSYGLYDWNGRADNIGTRNLTDVQQQGFITAGLFKRANQHSNFSYGVVHDWMLNQNWGAYAVNNTLGQWRAQIGYATSAWNEFGAWGTLRDMGDSNRDLTGATIYSRSYNQVNAFWHHKYEFGGDSWFWVGLPQDSRLNSQLGGNLGDFLVGGNVIAPLTDYLALYGNFQYMHPSARPGPTGDSESAWNVSFGLQWYVGGTARSSTVAGQCWVPLMPVANNGSFLTDAYRPVVN